MSRHGVLIASRLFTPEVSAGAFRLDALARAVAARGSAVRVVTTLSPRTPKATDPPGVEVSRWPVLRDRGGNVRGYVQYLSFDLPLFPRLLASRFDVVVVESPPTTGLVSVVAAWIKRRPVVYYAADVWTDGVISMGAPKLVVSIMRWMERAVIRRSDRVISVSDEVTDRLRMLGADSERIVTVGNGIDTDVFSDEVAPAQPRGSAARYFVYTGTMSEWQQPDVFIRALAAIAHEYPDVRIKFFGQGALEGDLRHLADEIVPGRVDFGGVVSPKTSASWIRGAVGALVSIVPGIGYDFARPTKTYAAAAVGTPVLFAGQTTGAKIVREAQLGVTTEFEPDSVAAAMRELLAAYEDGTSEARRQQRSQWAKERVSLSAVADRVAGVVSQVVTDHATKIELAVGRKYRPWKGQSER